MSTNNAYYIPHKATWPVIGTAGLVAMLAGFANYLNGSSIGTTTVTGPWAASNENITLGAAVGIHTYLTGNIAIGRIYTRGLSAAEILKNYNNNKTRFGL